MPKSSKRPATCAADGKPSKRPRANVHPLQERLAHRAADVFFGKGQFHSLANQQYISACIIATPMGTGKPRKEGDFVPNVFYGVHLSSPFAADLIAPAKERECLGDADAFKENEYMPLIEHHEDCETEEETDNATGEVTKTVTKCCEACKCIFSKGGDDEDEDE